jgi:hypothetical protein
MDTIRNNESLYNFIINKYKSFNEDTLIEFFKNDFYSNRLSLSLEDINSIIKIMGDLTSKQNIKFESIIFLGFGQSFATFKIGDVVLKIGENMDVEYSDYRLNPLYEHDFDDGISLYVSQYASSKRVTHNDVLDMYQQIKDSGGIWLDPKENNLGYVEKQVNSPNLFNIDVDIDTNKPYIIDYGDLIYLDEENKEYYIKWYGNDLDYNNLIYSHDYNDIYFHLFIQKRNDLLEIEKEIAIRNGDLDLAHSFEVQQMKNNEGKTNYYDSDYYSNDSNYMISNELLAMDRKNKMSNFFNKFKRH